ncbi:MAG: hypothetical protein RL497_1262 [Pseudomonadota bacterium]|jgi:ABC-type lipopolysaccharide export system ATPase subunit
MIIYIVIIAALLAAAILIFRTKNNSKETEKQAHDATWLLEAHNQKQNAFKQSEPFRIQIKTLLNKNPGWDELFAALNPNNHSEINDLLTQLKGPHLFAPHIAANMLETCLNKMEAQHLPVDSKTLLRMALEEGSKILDWHR